MILDIYKIIIYTLLYTQFKILFFLLTVLKMTYLIDKRYINLSLYRVISLDIIY